MTTSTLCHSLSELAISTTCGCCSAAFRLCRICSPRGSSSCSVQLPARPTISVSVALRSRTSLLANMMPRFGSVWLPFLAMTHPFQCGRWGFCPCTWGLVRTAPAAHWGSWADCLHTISECHAHIPHTMTDASISPSAAAVHLTGAVWSRASLAESGFVCPEWTALVQGLRPNQPGRDEVDPADHTHGWQFFTAQRVEHHFRAETVWPRLAPTEQALLRSQSGPMSGVAFSAVPSSPPIRLAPQLFRVLFPSHFSHLPVWPTTRSSWPPPCSVSESRSVGQSGIFCGERRSQGVSGSRGRGFHKSLCQGFGPACRSSRCSSVGGGRGWPASLWQGPVGHRHHSCVPRCVQMGNPEVSAPVRTEQAPAEAHRLKHRTYPELSGSQGRARLVVLAAEVGGRW